MTDQEIRKAVWDAVEKGNKVFVYATVDTHNHPHARYMGALMIKEGVIYMATYSESRKIQQIKANPHSEIVFAGPEYKEVVTMDGESRIDESLELKKEFWQANPICKDYFSGYDTPEFGLIAFEPRSAEYLNLALQHEPFVISLP
ncbi:MAG: pyridoxamine 5'-phosphate oxidase family protein [Pirellulales bacterium]|nr:pyridoxamine 5'-phosphate oxidase family protein [Pirellulales bacterium]